MVKFLFEEIEKPHINSQVVPGLIRSADMKIIQFFLNRQLVKLNDLYIEAVKQGQFAIARQFSSMKIIVNPVQFSSYCRNVMLLSEYEEFYGFGMVKHRMMNDAIFRKSLWNYSVHNVKNVEWLLSNNCPWDENLMDLAVKLARRSIIRFILDNNLPYNEPLPNWARMLRGLSVLKYE